MKKFFTLLVLAACCAAMTWGCSDDKYDDTEIRQEIENLKQEIASMKEQVNSLKTIIDALNENKFITNYTEAADGSCTITFNDGKTITLHNGKDGAAAPAIGIAQFEGIYYWTLGGDDQWLLDDNQNKIPVAGQNGKTPTINKDGYWEIDGETIKGEDGQPIKAVGKDGANGDKGEDGDSFFKSVVQDDENVTFTLTNGDQIVLPKAKEVNFVIERTSLTLKFGASQNLAVTQKGVENLAIAKPDGWRAWLEGDVLTITAPAKENVYAETSGEVSVVAVGATATVIAKVQVLATDEILGGAGAGSSEWEERRGGESGAGRTVGQRLAVERRRQLLVDPLDQPRRPGGLVRQGDRQTARLHPRIFGFGNGAPDLSLVAVHLQMVLLQRAFHHLGQRYEDQDRTCEALLHERHFARKSLLVPLGRPLA